MSSHKWSWIPVHILRSPHTPVGSCACMNEPNPNAVLEMRLVVIAGRQS
jgi:hypothetical protein